ncbi:hypothetical protein ABPG74_005527 [Tetrahymena malaccensis]
MSTKVQETIYETKKNMIIKLNGLFNYEQRIKDEFYIYSGQQQLKDIMKKINESYEEKTQSLMQTFEQLQKNKKSQQQKILEIIKQSKEEQSQLNLEQPKKMEEFIIKYIEKIDCFENKKAAGKHQLEGLNSTNSQIVYKLIKNIFNQCPDNFLDQIREKLEFLSDSFDDLIIDEEWKRNLFQNDLDKLRKDAFQMFLYMIQKFLNQQTTTNLNKSQSYIQDNDNIESIVKLINNPFNYCRYKYKEYLIKEFHHLMEYISILKIPKQYENTDERDLHEKVLELQEPVLKEINQLLFKINPNPDNNKMKDFQERYHRLEKNFKNPNQGLAQEPLLTQLKDLLQNMPQIYITLFYNDQNMYDFPLSINSSHLSEQQINMINCVTRKIQENKQKNIQISDLTNHFLSFFSCYKNYNGNQNYTDQIIKNIPIFDTFFEMPVYKKKIKLEFESRSYGLEKQGIKIQKQNNYDQNSIFIEKQSDSCVFTNKLDIRANYIIRIKFSEAIGSRYFQFGFEEKNKLEAKLNVYDCFFITSINKDYILQIRGIKQYFTEFIKSRDQIEIRACFKNNIIYLTDFPTYNFIYTIRLNNFNTDFISFAIRVGTSVEKYVIEVTDCYQVDDYILQYFEQ